MFLTGYVPVLKPTLLIEFTVGFTVSITKVDNAGLSEDSEPFVIVAVIEYVPSEITLEVISTEVSPPLKIALKPSEVPEVPSA